MPSRRQTFRKNVISGFRWLALFLFLLLAYWWGMTNYVIRDFWDPPYVSKAELLKARLREYPGHPLWLIMGSSRVDQGLRPGLLLDTMRAGGAPIIFNFGIGGADLFRQFVQLRRLLADGVKPQRVGIEMPGALMDRRSEMFADDPRLLVRARRDELGELCRYGANPAETRHDWMQSRFNPFFKYGMQVPNQTLAVRLLPLPGMGHFESHPYDAWGWYVGPPGAPPKEEYLRRLESARGEYVGDFTDQFAISPQFDEVMHKTLDLCKNAGIDVFLFRMPEDNDFQAFYPAKVNAAIDAYQAKIESEYQVRMIDARSWFPTRDNFVDGHHLNATGAEEFTRRFFSELSGR